MNELSRTPEVIAIEINSIKNQTREIVLHNSIEIGRRLMEAKELIGHGDWGTWLENSVDYSERTAENLIKIFKEYGSDQITLLDDNLKTKAFANLSYSQALALLGLPADQREDFIKENNINDMSTRQLQQVVKEKKELEQKLKDAEDKAEQERKNCEVVSDSYKKLEIDNKKNTEKAEKLKKKLDSIEDKHKEELTNKEVEIENFKTEIERINKELKAAESSGDNEEVEKLQKSLQESENKLLDATAQIKNLEEQLKDKPIDVKEIEKIPEETVKELEELRLKVKQNDDKAAVKFSVIFDQLIKSFNDLLTTLAAVQDPEIQKKYKAAVSGLISKMQERL